MPVSLRVDAAPAAARPALRELFDDYLLELAAIADMPAVRDATGHVAYRYFDDYWTDPARLPFNTAAQAFLESSRIRAGRD